MADLQASSSRACSSPSKAPPVPPTGMRSPTKIRTPTKLVRPRESLWASRNRGAKKRLLDAADELSESALPRPKRVKVSTDKATAESETTAGSGKSLRPGDALKASADENCTGYEQRLRRQVQVARCLEEDLLRDNARMRLQALSLREVVDFYYGLLAKMELVVAQQRPGEEHVAKLREQLQRIFRASKPVETQVSVVKEQC
ncbi:unnamed protein product [Phytophthora lilii]|uniref:Unnamed protein product n=1 Tax=Phytophthora lilii TaxID=2077276 RepID=A0A9W6TFE1_9STRA|nr:unnamed protein product [Phytophthora lilii]